MKRPEQAERQTDGKSSGNSQKNTSAPISGAEFAVLMAAVCKACGAMRWNNELKRNTPDLVPGQVELYHRMIEDIPAEIVKMGAARMIAEATFRGLPTAGALRSACITVALGVPMTAGEAWEKARNVLRRISIYLSDEQRETLLRDIPESVRRIVKRLGGWYVMKDIETNRAREMFMSEFSRSVQSERQRLLQPGSWSPALAIPAPEMKRLEKLPGE